MCRRQTPGREGEGERGRLERLSLVFYCHPCTLACEILDIIYKRKTNWNDGECTLRLLLIAGTNFSEFSGDQKNR